MRASFYKPRGIYYRKNDFYPKRETLVFIHGLGGSSSAWSEYERQLEGSYNILTFDLRGHGMSKKYTQYEDYTVDTMVEDVRRLSEMLYLAPFCLVSHSFGTVIALAFIHKYPHKVRAAIFLSPVLHMQAVGWVMMARMPLGWFARLIALFPFFPGKGRHVNYAHYRHTGDWNLRRMFADIPNTNFHIYFYCLRYIYESEHDGYWHEIRVPTLIVHGERDTISPIENGREIAEMITGAAFVPLANANHMLVLNNAEQLVVILERFLDRSCCSIVN